MHDMRPDRVLLRFLSWPEIKRAFGAKTVRVTAETRKRDAERMARQTKQPAKKVAANKPTAVRKSRGQFNGRAAMDPRERAMFERAEQGYVDPVLMARNSRTRRG